MPEPIRLGQSFYDRETISVARDLLGKVLVRQVAGGRRLAGVIIEVEAYLANDDRASHSHRGRGASNASMFLPAGTFYVYPIHAKYCLNVVTEPQGIGAAVLIRALQPTEGIAMMIDNRGTHLLNRLTTGPARLCQALDVDRSCDGLDLTTNASLWIESEPDLVAARPWSVRASSRIGISQAVDLPLRWFIDGNRYVSGCARDHSCRRDWGFEVG